jgi:hypothetical protein
VGNIENYWEIGEDSGNSNKDIPEIVLRLFISILAW